MLRYPRLLPVLLAAGLALLPGCETFRLKSRYDQAIEAYADIVYASYDDSYQAAAELKAAIDAFVAAPSFAGFESCKIKWLAARVPYGQTEAYRFYGGPIDGEDGPEGLINAWPMDEAFVDYVESDPDAGLINRPDLYPEISKEVLESLNESISETSIFTGYHAIEFLLWGQDLSAGGPGSRPYTDYLQGPGGTASNQARRAQYLQASAALLVDHLAEVRDAWAQGASYRESFLSTDYEEILGRIFTSLGELSKGELAGERMFVALDSRDQENEHSCFSDNTHIDIEMNFQGLWNVYYGVYTRADGTVVTGEESLAGIAERVDEARAQAADEAFAAAQAAVEALPAPFDQAILNQDARIVTAIEALRTLSDRLTDVGFAMGATF